MPRQPATRLLEVPGYDLPGIHYLRTIADVEASAPTSPGAQRLVIVGAGYIGLEAAASARHLGLDVTVLEMADRPLNRVVAPEMSTFYMHRHEREGVRVLCNMSVTAFKGDAAGCTAVVCGEREFPADFVIVGVGILPETTLAAAAGLRCENGIWVDEQCQTSDPNIYAAGDCTFHPSVRYGRRVAARIGGQRRRAGARRRPRTSAASRPATSTCRGSGRTSTT